MAGRGHHQKVEIMKRLRYVVCPPAEFYSGGSAGRANSLLVSGIGKQGSTCDAKLHFLSIRNRGCDAEKIQVPFFRGDTSQDPNSNRTFARVSRAKAVIRYSVVDHPDAVCTKQHP